MTLDDLVFSNIERRPVDPGTLTKTFRRIADGVGMRCRFHDLRHTFASLMLMAGVSANVVSEALGHSSVDSTLGTYSHVLPTTQKTAMSNPDKLLGPAMPENQSVSNSWGFTRGRLAGAAGLEPATGGFGDRCSTS